MGMLKIYGASDDLIEIEGDVREEFDPGYRNPCGWIEFADGTIVSVVLTDFWRVTTVRPGAAVETERLPAFESDNNPPRRPDGTPEYSEVVTYVGDNLTPVTFHRQRPDGLAGDPA